MALTATSEIYVLRTFVKFSILIKGLQMCSSCDLAETASDVKLSLIDLGFQLQE